MKKGQMLIIHGGMTFKGKRNKTRKIYVKKRARWSEDYLDKKLGKSFEIIRPRMPLQDNAKYDEWKLHFEKYFPYLKNNIVLIGNSLGEIFLAKYLSENKFSKKIRSTYLISPPFDNTMRKEKLAVGFRFKTDLSLFKKNSPKISLIFSNVSSTFNGTHYVYKHDRTFIEYNGVGVTLTLGQACQSIGGCDPPGKVNYNINANGQLVHTNKTFYTDSPINNFTLTYNGTDANNNLIEVTQKMCVQGRTILNANCA